MDLQRVETRMNTNLSFFSDLLRVCVFHLWLFFCHSFCLVFLVFFIFFSIMFFLSFAKIFNCWYVHNQSNANFFFQLNHKHQWKREHTHTLRIHYSFNYSFLVVETHLPWHKCILFIYDIMCMVLLNSMCVCAWCVYSHFGPRYHANNKWQHFFSLTLPLTTWNGNGNKTNRTQNEGKNHTNDQKWI